MSFHLLWDIFECRWRDYPVASRYGHVVRVLEKNNDDDDALASHAHSFTLAKPLSYTLCENILSRWSATDPPRVEVSEVDVPKSRMNISACE